MIELTETESKESLDKLVTAFEEIITEALSEAGRELIKTAPHSTKYSRFDEVKAIKEPILSKSMEKRTKMFDESRNPFNIPKDKLPRLPKWLRNQIPKFKFDELIEKMPLDGMTTVCKEAMCPNRGECISRGIVTVMILGSECTRACTFCAVSREAPPAVDPAEPEKMLNMVNYMDPLKYVVITAPTRDDLFDGGASQFRKVTEHIKKHRTRY